MGVGRVCGIPIKECHLVLDSQAPFGFVAQLQCIVWVLCRIEPCCLGDLSELSFQLFCGGLFPVNWMSMDGSDGHSEMLGWFQMHHKVSIIEGCPFLLASVMLQESKFSCPLKECVETLIYPCLFFPHVCFLLSQPLLLWGMAICWDSSQWNASRSHWCCFQELPSASHMQSFSFWMLQWRSLLQKFWTAHVEEGRITKWMELGFIISTARTSQKRSFSRSTCIGLLWEQ